MKVYILNAWVRHEGANTEMVLSDFIEMVQYIANREHRGEDYLVVEVWENGVRVEYIDLDEGRECDFVENYLQKSENNA